MTYTRQWILAASVSLGALWSAPALCQTATQPSQATTLDEIVVTAQRREQAIQDVPLSITAIAGAKLEELGLNTPAEVFSQVPNVKAQMPTGSAGFPIFNIRGITLLDFSDSNEASVAVYADDIYLGSPAVQNQQLFDIERVEVLRGPQGTLYGRNATGGLVNFIARNPTGTFGGYLSGAAGSNEAYTAEGAISGPLSDRLRGRVAARYFQRDGWQENLFNGNRLGGVDHSLAIRGLATFDVTDSFTLKGNLHYSDFEGQEDGRAFFGARVVGSNPAVRCSTSAVLSSQCSNASGFIDPAPDPTHVYSEEDSLPAAVESYGGWLRGEWDLGFATLTSITSYDHATKLDTLDADQSPSPAGRLTLVYNTEHEQASQELRLTGSTDSLDWIVGGYYYQDTRFFTATLIRLAGNGSWADQDVETAAAFAQATWAASDTVNLTAGVRYTSDSRDLNALAKVASGGVPGTRLGTQQYLISRNLDSERTTWRLAADWHFQENHMVYASASTGFKSGAFNTLLPAANPATVVAAKPEFTTAYEIGIKGDFFDRRLTYSVALFDTDYQNIQASGTLANPTPVSSLDTIGNATIRGLEAELNVAPVEGLTASFGLGLLNTEIEAPATFLYNGVLINGNELVMSPHVSYNGLIRYERPVERIGTLSVTTDFQWQDAVFFGPDNLATETQGAYGLINVHLGWESPNGDLSFDAFVKNLGDEEYFVHGVDSGGATQVGYQWGRNRTWGVELRKTF